jgi:hypothetical protein
MNLIQKTLFIGATAYIGIILLQLFENVSIRIQAAGAAILLALAIVVISIQNEAAMKKYEMIILWCCVLLFGLYSILTLGGLLW